MPLSLLIYHEPALLPMACQAIPRVSAPVQIWGDFGGAHQAQ